MIEEFESGKKCLQKLPDVFQRLQERQTINKTN